MQNREVVFKTQYYLMTNPIFWLKVVWRRILQIGILPYEIVNLLIHTSRMETAVKSHEHITFNQRMIMSLYFGVSSFLATVYVVLSRLFDLALAVALINRRRACFYVDTGEELNADEVRHEMEKLIDDSKDLWKE